MHGTAHLEVTDWEMVHNYLGASEGTVSNIHWSYAFGILL